jgi:hypothetical protein
MFRRSRLSERLTMLRLTAVSRPVAIERLWLNVV